MISPQQILNARILIVDDQKLDVLVLEKILKSAGYANLRVTTDSQKTSAIYQEWHPDLVLLDLNMPKMNGIEFLRIVKTDNRIKRIPVVVLTTSKEEPDRVNTFDLGIAGYMIKPVDYLQFVEVIKTINLYWMLSESPG